MVDLTIFENRFQENFGAYVLNLGLSHYNYLNTQKLEMRFNWVQRNVIKEPWLGFVGAMTVRKSIFPKCD